MTFFTLPIDDTVVDHVRYTRTDPVYGYPYNVRADEAGPHGYGPCRSCLRRFRQGERRLLFLFNPFTSRFGDYAGPVFIHENECEPFDGQGFPPDIREVPLLLRAYDANLAPVADAKPAPETIEKEVDHLLTDPQTSTLHIRNDEARCFIARVTASPTGGDTAPELDGMTASSHC